MAARTARVPAFPVYRALRLRYEALTAVTSNPSRAVAVLNEAQRLSPGLSTGGRLGLALEKQGAADAARDLWLELVRYPARYWLEPERQEPAIFRDALIHASKTEMAARVRLQALNEAGRQLV